MHYANTLARHKMVESLAKKYKLDPDQVHQMIKDKYNLLLKYGDISSLLGPLPWKIKNKDILLEDREEARTEIIKGLQFDIEKRFELIDELGLFLNKERLGL